MPAPLPPELILLIPPGAATPLLGRMLRLARREAAGAESLSQKLARLAGHDTDSAPDFPWGPLLARGIRGAPPTHPAWYVATPVCLEARMDRLVLAGPAGLPDGADPEEARMLREHLNAHFNDGNPSETMHFYPGPDGHWLLNLPEPLPARSEPVDAIAGGPIDAGRAGDRGRRALARLMNEIQMRLFEHPVNQAREARGVWPFNGVWLWGGGSAVPALPAGLRFRGRHPLLDALAAAAPPAAPPAPDGRTVVLHDPGDEGWLRDRLADLRRGRLTRIRIEPLLEPRAHVLGRFAAWGVR